MAFPESSIDSGRDRDSEFRQSYRTELENAGGLWFRGFKGILQGGIAESRISVVVSSSENECLFSLYFFNCLRKDMKFHEDPQATDYPSWPGNFVQID
ncbi:unnamed protein product, partial [Heterotrigona itama]